MPELDAVKKLFLTEVDEETRLDNEKKIEEWEMGLRTNEALADWRDHDITRQIAEQARETYKDIAFVLSTNRALDDGQRRLLWGKQDGCLFILSLTDVDARGRIEQIQKEIRTALNATKQG